MFSTITDDKLIRYYFNASSNIANSLDEKRHFATRTIFLTIIQCIWAEH